MPAPLHRRGPPVFAQGNSAPSEEERINPYAVSLDSERWQADGLLNGAGMSVAEARRTPAGGIENLLMSAVAQLV